MPRNYADILARKKPEAAALIKGSDAYPDINGVVYFYQTKDGVLITAKINGLPHDIEKCESKVFGFHIHGGESCTGTEASPFENTGSHYNKFMCEHPHHSGDMPPLFENNGMAYMSFLTNRISVADVIGKTVVIHSQPDDFVSQPAGNSGIKIACGKIKRLMRMF